MSAYSLSRVVAVLPALPWLAATAVAQAPAGPPVRDLGTPIAVSEAIFSTGTTVRGLPHGQALVNDGRGRRVVMLDSALRITTVVLDTTMARSYGRQQGFLMRYLGDSSLFLDIRPPTVLILDASGRVVRTGAGMSGIASLGAVLLPDRGVADVDGRGRLVYRAPPPTAGAARTANVGSDSAYVAAWSVATHQTDTVAVIRVQKTTTFVPARTPGAAPTIRLIIDPLPFVDGWTVLSDGGVAAVRARDYHVDWINADGTREATARLPFPWEKLTEDKKRHLVDSTAAAVAQEATVNYYRDVITWANAWNQPYPADFTIPPTIVISRLQPNMKLPAGYTLPTGYAFASVGSLYSGDFSGPVPRPPVLANILRDATPVLPVDQIADYWPPFLGEATRGDADGNVWVRTLTQGAPGKVATYDVIGRTGIIDRVRLRENQSLVGFGPGRLVYLLVREDVVQHLAVVRR
jgi:hypothetical protein